MSEPWKNCVLPKIPKEERVKRDELGICKGGCNRLIRIHNTPRQLCMTCDSKRRYVGEECEIPSCGLVADGSIGFHSYNGYIFCKACYYTWNRNKSWAFERLIEERASWLARPDTFTKALEEGLVSLVKNQVMVGDEALCHNCEELSIIDSPTYQLCRSCRPKLQYLGEECFVCPLPASLWDTNDGVYACAGCASIKSKYNISSYSIIKYQIASQTNCMICDDAISYGRDGNKGSMNGVGCIDHDHKTGKIRGVLCHICNTIEGYISRMDCPEEWAKKLVNYLETPPLDIHGIH